MIYSEQRYFSIKDQQLFSRLSGDYNYIHLDHEKARRSIFGSLIVHGINLVLTSLDFLSKQKPILHCKDISAEFIRPVYLNEPTDFLYKCYKTKCHIEIIQNKKSSVKILLLFNNSQRNKEKKILFEQYNGLINKINLNLFKAYYPHLTLNKANLKLSELLVASKIVGMIEPGEHSLFSKINIRLETHNLDQKVFIKKLDEIQALQLVFQEILTSSYVFLIKAFKLKAPVNQRPMEVLRQYVPKTRFLGDNSLVVGGSRGLGELTCKCLTLGGSGVSFTYHNGKKDAIRLLAELKKFGRNINALRLDIKFHDPNVLFDSSRKFTRLYYFATPKILYNHAEYIDTELLKLMNEFYNIYFLRVAEAFVKNGGQYIFYPSTVLINEPILSLKEYILAKKSGELCCDFLRLKYPKVVIDCPKLDPILTDQTQNLLNNKIAPELDLKFVNTLNQV